MFVQVLAGREPRHIDLCNAYHEMGRIEPALMQPARDTVLYLPTRGHARRVERHGAVLLIEDHHRLAEDFAAAHAAGLADDDELWGALPAREDAA